MHAPLHSEIAQALNAIVAASHLIKRFIRYSSTVLSSSPSLPHRTTLCINPSSAVTYIASCISSNSSCRSDSRARRFSLSPTRQESPLKERNIYFAKDLRQDPFRPAPLVRVTVACQCGKGKRKKENASAKDGGKALNQAAKSGTERVFVCLYCLLYSVPCASILPKRRFIHHLTPQLLTPHFSVYSLSESLPDSLYSPIPKTLLIPSSPTHSSPRSHLHECDHLLQ